MHGWTARSFRWIFLGCWVLVVGAAASGCANSDADSAEGTTPATRFTPDADPLPAVVTTPTIVLPSGGPSGRFDEADFGVSFRHHSFLHRSIAKGRGFQMVTLRHGNGRIVLTSYEAAQAPQTLVTTLRESVEAHYRGAMFPHRSPRLVQIGNTRVPQRTLEGNDPHPWQIAKPNALPSELGYSGEDEDLLYTEIRRRSWDGSGGTTDRFSRAESWEIDKNIWERSIRRLGTTEYFGLSGSCFFDSERYLVELEAASGPTRSIHIVYFYPYTDYPVMQDIIATFRASLQIN